MEQDLTQPLSNKWMPAILLPAALNPFALYIFAALSVSSGVEGSFLLVWLALFAQSGLTLLLALHSKARTFGGVCKAGLGAMVCAAIMLIPMGLFNFDHFVLPAAYITLFGPLTLGLSILALVYVWPSSLEGAVPAPLQNTASLAALWIGPPFIGQLQVRQNWRIAALITLIAAGPLNPVLVGLVVGGEYAEFTYWDGWSALASSIGMLMVLAALKIQLAASGRIFGAQLYLTIICSLIATIALAVVATVIAMALYMAFDPGVETHQKLGATLFGGMLFGIFGSMVGTFLAFPAGICALIVSRVCLFELKPAH